MLLNILCIFLLSPINSGGIFSLIDVLYSIFSFVFAIVSASTLDIKLLILYFPFSIFSLFVSKAEISRIASINSVKTLLALYIFSVSLLAISSVKGFSFNKTSLKPRIVLIGVLISCDIFIKNSVFALSAIAASSFEYCNS